MFFKKKPEILTVSERMTLLFERNKNNIITLLHSMDKFEYDFVEDNDMIKSILKLNSNATNDEVKKELKYYNEEDVKMLVKNANKKVFDSFTNWLGKKHIEITSLNDYHLYLRFRKNSKEEIKETSDEIEKWQFNS